MLLPSIFLIYNARRQDRLRGGSQAGKAVGPCDRGCVRVNLAPALSVSEATELSDDRSRPRHSSCHGDGYCRYFMNRHPLLSQINCSVFHASLCSSVVP
jgi:hypothetical protein